MFGRRSQDDFEDEIRAHIALETERLRQQGLSPAEAERAARRGFGNVGIAEDRFYHAQRLVSVQNVARDVQHAWRALRRTPGFFATCVLTLALAMGALTGMFSVVNAVILKPLSFPDPDRLVAIAGTAPGSELPEPFELSEEFFVHYKEHSTLIDGIFIFDDGTATFRTDDRVERIRMAFPSIGMYATLGATPQLGRLPTPEDGDRVAVISDELWSSWFGRDPSVIGKSYFVSDTLKQIIGVMHPSFHFPTETNLVWVGERERTTDIRPGRFGASVVARLKPGVTPEQLVNELTRLSKELPARFGGTPEYARIIERHRAVVTPLLDYMVGPSVRTSLWILLASVSVVLLIACANVANLFLVRAEGRVRDMALRRAIGASSAQLVRLQLCESLVVAVCGGVLAIVVSRFTLPLFLEAAPDRIPRLVFAGVDARSLVAVFVLVVLTAMACGTIPALRAASPDLQRLREGGRGATGVRTWGRDLLVIGQTALALVLLIGSALLVQSFSKLRNVDPGYATRDLYTFQFAPDQPHLNAGGGRAWGTLHADAMSRLRALPGVTDVGVVNNLPLDEDTRDFTFISDDTRADGKGNLVNINFTGGDYFRAMSIDLLQGRAFTPDEALSPNTSVIVSRSAAARLWPNRDALGQRLQPRFGGEVMPWFTVVGVVEDVKQSDWREEGQATAYFPLTGPTDSTWSFSSPAYVVKSSRADALRQEVRDVIRSVAPEAPVYREFTMEFLAERSMVQLSFTMLTLGVVSGLALLLGALGLYGVLSYVVTQRRREIGVRMALGASSSMVQRQIVAQGTRVVLAGVALGLVAAVTSTRLMQALLFGVRAVDVTVFVAMALAMVAIGALASYMPARRASRGDPMICLRND